MILAEGVTTEGKTKASGSIQNKAGNHVKQINKEDLMADNNSQGNPPGGRQPATQSNQPKPAVADPKASAQPRLVRNDDHSSKKK